MDTNDIRTFARVSSSSNRVVERRLWRTFRIHSAMSSSPQEVIERCEGLLRLTHRAQIVSRIIIGPCTWSWNDQSLRYLQLLWIACPRINEIFLEMPEIRFHDGYKYGDKHGGEFAPVFRSLATHGTHLKINVLKYEGWLIPDSPLHIFLGSQPSITRLVGTDVFATQAPPLSTGFLPSLKELVCGEFATVFTLLPGRPIVLLDIMESLSLANSQSFWEACRKTIGPLDIVKLRIGMLGGEIRLKGIPVDVLEGLVARLGTTRSLQICCPPLRDRDLRILRGLKQLRTLRCTVWREDLIKECPILLSPSLQELVFNKTETLKRMDPLKQYVTLS